MEIISARGEEVEGPLRKKTSPREPPPISKPLSKKERTKTSLPFVFLFPPLPSSSLLFRGSYKNNNNLLNEKKPIILLSSSSFFSSKGPFVQQSDTSAFFFVVGARGIA